MADERNEEEFGENQASKAGQQTTALQSQQSELGQQQGQQAGGLGSQENMSNQGSEASFGGQSSGEGSSSQSSNDGTSGQPIGGNDSNTGSGTTLSQGAEFDGQSSNGQTQDSDGDTMMTLAR